MNECRIRPPLRRITRAWARVRNGEPRRIQVRWCRILANSRLRQNRSTGPSCGSDRAGGEPSVIGALLIGRPPGTASRRRGGATADEFLELCQVKEDVVFADE